MKRILTIMLAVLPLAAFAASQPEPKKSLFDRLGGVHQIAAVVSDFFGNMSKDQVLAANPKIIEANQKLGRPFAEFHLTAWLCHASGGPQMAQQPDFVYLLRSMDITEDQWKAATADFKQAMTAHNMSENDQKAVGALFDKAYGQSKSKVTGMMKMDFDKMDKMMNSNKTLYARLGGAQAIAAVVDDFINHLATSPDILGNPKVVASLTKGDVTGAGIKYLVTEQLIYASGGPARYTGKTMVDAHKGMGITDKEWDASAQLLKDTLGRFKVPAKEQGELFAIISKTKGDIVRH